ncbi:glycoside hydrolase superfamily, partial [Roridomyces roridus]
PGQQLCVSKGTAPGPPKRNSDGSCATYTTVHDDSCSAIAAKFFITTKDIEAWNAHTFQWKGCARLGAKYKLCISTGTPPPPPIIPGLQCGPQSAGNASCPLKACCGAFGFCGLTEEFCTTSQGPNPCIRDCGLTKLPSCSSSSTLSRKIGYYAGWGDYRSCGVNVAPDQINWENFTGAHYAFATISQDLKIQLADTDVPLLKKLVAQRSRWPKLQVVIAVGGWAFSCDAPTKDLFSVMISNKANRATFISSVAAFLKEYELQGIDIDFEYPGAIERGAPATGKPTSPPHKFTQ